MIRKFEIGDLTNIMRIWLESNIKAHDFIDDSYWHENYEMVSKYCIKPQYLFSYCCYLLCSLQR